MLYDTAKLDDCMTVKRFVEQELNHHSGRGSVGVAQCARTLQQQPVLSLAAPLDRRRLALRLVVADGVRLQVPQHHGGLTVGGGGEGELGGELAHTEGGGCGRFGDGEVHRGAPA